MLNKFWNFLPLRAFLAGAVAQIGSIAFACLIYQSTLNQGGYFVELVASISQTAAYLLSCLILPLAVGWAMRLPNFLRIGSIAGAAQVVCALMFSSGTSLSPSPQLLATVCVVAGIIMLITWFAGSLADKMLPPAPAFIVVATLIIGTSAGLSWLENGRLEKANAAAEKARKQAHINEMLRAIDFPIYLPQSIPQGYKLFSIAPVVDDHILNSPNRLRFYYVNKSPQLSIELNEFRSVRLFNAPSDCGPYNARSLELGPSPLAIPCHEVAHAGQTAIYENQDGSSSPFEYGYYFRINSTEITLDTKTTKLDSSQLADIVNGLKPVTTDELTKELLSEN